MTTTLRIALLTRYAAKGASSRVRALQFRPLLAEHGLKTEVFPLLGDDYLTALYAGRRDAGAILRAYASRLACTLAWRRHDLIWVEKELFPMAPAWLERLLLTGRPYVLDYDDAVFHTYDRSRNGLIRGLLGHKIDRLMRGSRVVTAGNGYLADRALGAGAGRVERLPSCIDLQRYPTPPVREPQNGPFRVVWIGSPATATYLDLLREPLVQLARQRAVVLRVVGAAAPAWAQVGGLEVEALAWSADREAADLSAADVGVMPLHDSPWEQGKCSFKLIQYMACGLPVVASPVGMNRDVVLPGGNGWLAADAGQWLQALQSLANDPQQRLRMGRQGRALVETSYCIQAQAPRLAAWLREAAARH